MVNIVIFGAPGSGKGTQSEFIIERHGLHHISTGEVLRDEIAKESELGKIADGYISKGHLIPDELMIDILDKLIDDKILRKGVIFDGFPRTINQAKALKAMLNNRGTDISAVIGLEVPENLLVERLVKRGKESGRSDDNEETIINRIQVYHNNTAPLMDYYKQEGLYFPIDGGTTIEAISDEINGVLTEILEKEANALV
ncbi:MAG: adenylate kinase [Candidatus Azobacteroides sp.]|nr:adenylate kinase [Candidatus Azobacteroides sp.]